MSSSVEEIRFISTKIVSPSLAHNAQTDQQEVHLTPWDLRFLRFPYSQKGLLYLHQSTTPPTTPSITSLIDRLESSLSLTLAHFSPLAGRLATTAHHDGTISVRINCNNAGAELVHAIAPHVTVADVLNPVFVPHIVREFFPYNGNINYEENTPLLAIQVTELVDGVFIGIAMNHVVVDGTSFWHFVNAWAEVSRTGSDRFVSAHPPILKRWFKDTSPPIRFRFGADKESNENPRISSSDVLVLEERVFHFSAESIAQLKAKANAELGTKKISSLQALMAHIWLAVTRARGLCGDEVTRHIVLMGNRPRLVPALPKEYFGNSFIVQAATAEAGELLKKGIGETAKILNEIIEAHNDEAIRRNWESWVKEPVWAIKAKGLSNTVSTTSSPRFDVYGNDFGWGRPVAVRTGWGYKMDGLVSVFEGVEKGSMDFEVCLLNQTLVNLGEDPEFMRTVTAHNSVAKLE